MTSKLFLPVIAGLVTASAFGQATVTTTTRDSTAMTSPVPAGRTRTTSAERIVMANGALAEISGMRATRIDMETVLPGGVHVTPGGTVTFTDGTTTNMRDGQMITMDGKVSAASPDYVAAANIALDAGTTGAAQHATDRAAGASAAAAAAAAQSTQRTTNSTETGSTSTTPAPGTVSSGTGAVQGHEAMGSGIGVRTISPDSALTPTGAASPASQMPTP